MLGEMFDITCGSPVLCQYMSDSPVESSPVQFCVSIRLTVQFSPVESSIVLKQLAVQSSPVESSFVSVYG